MEICDLVSGIVKICQLRLPSCHLQTQAGILETHHFAKWSFVLLGCIIKISL